MSQMYERVLIRLERAGGDLSEAAQIGDQPGGVPAAFSSKIVKLNVAIGDLRRAMIRFQNGEDINVILEELDRQLREVGNDGRV